MSSITRCAMLVALLLLTGCQKAPPTNADDLVRYVANAASGAEVRRLDPPAQAYVARLFKAYRAWRDPIESIADPAKVWPIDDNAWRDAEACRARLDPVRGFLADGIPDASGSERSGSFAHLQHVIDDVPLLSSAGNKDLRERIARALAVHGQTLSEDARWYETVARGYEPLLTFALDHADGFDPKTPGLAFTDPALTERARALRSGLHALLRRNLDQRYERIDEALSRDRTDREQRVKQRQVLLRTRRTDPDTVRKLRDLELEIKYFDHRIAVSERLARRRSRERKEPAPTEPRP